MPFVLSLFFRRCPSAILFAVTFVIVYPVQSHTERTLAHVGQERWKIMQPSFTDLNAEGAVPSIACTLWIVTSRFHTIPCFISFGARTATTCVTMNWEESTRLWTFFVSCTSARSVPYSEAGLTNKAFGPTIAMTEPLFAIPFQSGAGSYDDPTAEPIPWFVFHGGEIHA